MFIDVAKIQIKAGKGGDGIVSFHREKYITSGGPDGGDGGRGGNVVLVVDDNLSTLMDFRYKRKYEAPSGAAGGPKKCSGRGGENLIIKVPRGTLVRHTETGAIIADMSGDEPFTLAKGGRGGWGNQHFATPTRQAPRFAKSGLPGEELDVTLELKLIADVGLAGFPNVGKSTLLSAISSARPKIANYHFTTLVPNLGLVSIDEGRSFVAADIPGIIEGASEGAGLGFEFLRHIERCRLVIHVIDASGSEGRDPAEDLDAVNLELSSYSPVLASRPQIIAANKCDIFSGEEPFLKLQERAEALGYPVYKISAATGEGVRELINAASDMLTKLPPVQVYEPDYIPDTSKEDTREPYTIRREGEKWIVEGQWLKRVSMDVNFSDYESRMYFDRVLRNAGVFEKLQQMGIKEGDTVSILDLEFDYIP